MKSSEIIAVAISLSTMACTGDGGGGDPPTVDPAAITIDNYVEALADAHCARVFACPFATSSLGDHPESVKRTEQIEAYCRRDLLQTIRDDYDWRRIHALVRAGRIRFDPAVAKDCVGAIRDCTTVITRFPSGLRTGEERWCPEAFVAANTSSLECAITAECAQDRPRDCDATFGSCGSCQPRGAAVGESCLLERCGDRRLLSPVYCSPNGMCELGSAFRQVVFKHEGESCATGEECDGSLWCDQQSAGGPICRGLGKDGETCRNDDAECDLQFYCDRDADVCRPLVVSHAVGDPCQSHFSDITPHGPICLLEEGLICASEKCIAYPAGEGDPCRDGGADGDGVCVDDLVCVDGLCAKPKIVGSPCQLTRECKFPLTCEKMGQTSIGMCQEYTRPCD